jgi:hypothetical protein
MYSLQPGQLLKFNFTKIRHVWLLSLLLILFLTLSYIALPFNTARAFTVTPIRLELSGDPGAVISGSFSVYNDSNTDRTLYTSAQNFEAKDETGNPVFVPGNDGLVSWVHMAASFDSKARQEVKIPFTISIPKNAEPGGYFAGLFASTLPNNAGAGQVALGSRIGTLLLLTVNGNISEGITVLEFGTDNSQRFFTSLPINFYYRFQNSGADRIKPLGDVLIKNIFGMTTKILNANKNNGNVLPKSIRRFETAWISSSGDVRQEPDAQSEMQNTSGFFASAAYEWHNFAFGIYNAHLNLAYGNFNPKSATASYIFFVFPWHLLLILIIILIILFFVLRFWLRRYNRYIISQAKRSRGQK